MPNARKNPKEPPRKRVPNPKEYLVISATDGEPNLHEQDPYNNDNRGDFLFTEQQAKNLVLELDGDGARELLIIRLRKNLPPRELVVRHNVEFVEKF